ncbi:MAG: hypothetical protein R3253_07685, partial [Longimicrobiales bacterium]|nr:hypothetical protein [Longimicrobiales bacterium]
MRVSGAASTVAALLVLALGGFRGEAPSLAGPKGPAPSPVRSTAEIEVVLTEGTNVAAALSPDGQTLALDLLGRIWTLPGDGGRATPITDPFGDARQPQWSPDGSRIVFQAYWGGNYDIWSVRSDGSGLTQLTHGPFDDREPAWSPDGRRIVFSSDRSGSYDIWELTLASGQIRRVTQGPGNEYTPALASDGTTLAYVADGDGSGVWVKPGQGTARRIVEGAGDDLYSPSWAPDDEAIAFVRIGTGVSGLWVTEPSGGAEPRRLTDDFQDVFPFRAAWTAAGEILYTADGGVKLRPASGGQETAVGFSAVVMLDRPPYRKGLRSFQNEGPHPVRGIVSPALSPDGRSVLFVALGDLWRMEIGNAPVRLTDDAFVEMDPAWSPDGGRYVYASDREGGTDLYLADATTGRERRITTDGGQMPAWAPDGRRIAYSGGGFQDGGIRVLDVETGDVRTIRSGLNEPGRPTWSPDGTRVVVSALHRYSTRYREGVNRALSIPVATPISEEDDGEIPALGAWEGPMADAPSQPASRSLPAPGSLQEGERWLDFARHASFASRGTDGPVWSPDGRQVAYVASGVLWVQPVSSEGDPVGPARRLNNEQTSDPSWAGDSRSILYLTTDRLRRVWLESGRIEDVPVPLTWSREVPDERYVVHAGEVFDGVSSLLRRNIDIVVAGNRIVRVEEHDDAL